MSKQDFILPVGDPAAGAFTPLTLVAGPNRIRGQAARDLFLERLSLMTDNAAPLAGEVQDVRVMKQSVVASDQSFPVEMVNALAFDDEALSLGLGIEGGTYVDVEYIPTAGEVGQALSGSVGTAALPDGVSPQEDNVDAYSWIFGCGSFTQGGAPGAWQLTAQALRDVYLGRLVVVSSDAGATLESVQVAKSEQFSGDGSILVSALGANATDTDGLTLAKVLKSGESMLLRGQCGAGAVVKAGVYLLDMDELL